MTVTSTETSFTVQRPSEIADGGMWLVRWRFRLATEEAWREEPVTTLPALTVQVPTSRPQGDGRLWAVEVQTGKMSVATGSFFQRSPSDDFSVAALPSEIPPEDRYLDEVSWPYCMWSDGATMWVGYVELSNWLTAFKLSDRSYDDAKRLRLATDPVFMWPRGLWSDGTTMWVLVVPNSRSRPAGLWAFNLATQARDSSKEISSLETLLGRTDSDITGLWSDGTTMWVGSRASLGNALTRNHIYAVTLSTLMRDESKEFTNTQLSATRGIRPTHITPNPFYDGIAHSIIAIWGDETTLYVQNAYSIRGNPSRAVGVRSYDLHTKQRTGLDTNTLGRDVDLDTMDPTATGLWSDGTTMWMGKYQRENGQLQAYTFGGAPEYHAATELVLSKPPRPAPVSDGTQQTVPAPLFPLNLPGTDMAAWRIRYDET